MRKNKTLLLSALMLMAGTAMAQTDVTAKYIENADFGARFAAWSNPGKFTYNVASNLSIFTNFRLYYYGSLTKDIITSIDEIANQYDSTISNTYYDLQGRAIKNPTRGIYIRDGKKILVK